MQVKETAGAEPEKRPARYQVTVDQRESNLARAVRVIRTLAGRDFKFRYRRTLLGPAWALLFPLVMTLVFTVIRSRVPIDVGDIPYPLFTYVGVQAWTILSMGTITAGPSIVSNSGIVKKIALPLEVFPLSAILLTVFDYLIGCIILAVMLVWYGQGVTFQVVWVVPMMALMLLLTYACALGVAALGTFRKDIIFGATFLLQVAMLASPVFYEIPTEQAFHWSYLNPAVGILAGFRAALLEGTPPPAGAVLTSLGVSLLLLSITWPLFRRVGRYFADVI
jgi:ABC-type polysaccharide/polyol phosphate export permease